MNARLLAALVVGFVAGGTVNTAFAAQAPVERSAPIGSTGGDVSAPEASPTTYSLDLRVASSSPSPEVQLGTGVVITPNAPDPVAALTGVWRDLAECESSLDPRAVGAGRYFGLFQFDLETWRSVGGEGSPLDASVDEQLFRAQTLQASRGWQPWPQCAAKLGLGR